eukprot:Sspe_Gene.116940::Locus_107134_Transcript_1_1_Confidence_1.000_Length_1128::g.116940::m.116940
MQRGVRYLRQLQLWYRDDVPKWHHEFGGMKEWVDDWLPHFRRSNPEVNVIVHPITDVRFRQGDKNFPRATGEYINGSATTWALYRMSSESIDMAIHEMRNTCNDCEARPAQHEVVETKQPSIQGMWTPYLWMKDKTVPQEFDAQAGWREDLQDIARYVRTKKEHREREFREKYAIELSAKEKMEQRWKEEVFPYTIGPETKAIPGRLFLEETRSIIQDAGQRPPDSAMEGSGSGFMGGFVSPMAARGHDSMSVTGPDKYSTAFRDQPTTVPPFAGAPFTTGYGDYENFWQNWDLFHAASPRYVDDDLHVARSDTEKAHIAHRKREKAASQRHLYESEQQRRWDDES